MKHSLPALVFLLVSALARAENAAPADTGGSLLQMFSGLFVVLALLVGSLWFLKRLTQPHGPGSGLLRVVAGTPVGPRERVVVLEVGSTWLVLGVAPGRVSALAEVPRQEMPAELPPGQNKDFSGWLRQIVERRSDAPK